MYQGENIVVQQSGDGIAELVFDVQNSTVNIFNAQTVSDLSAALDVIESSSDIQGLFIKSAKNAFIAGADIKEFGPVFAQGPKKIAELLNRSNRNFNRLESLPFPVVVAIKGFALGGGCEITLACDYRIASHNASIGLPETRLGIIPGWGGSVRLPRIAGIETAVEWITTGKEQKSVDALSVGVIDGVVTEEHLDRAAREVLNQCIHGQLDYRQRREQKQSPLKHNQTERIMAFTTCKAMVASQAGKHYPAPMAVVKAMEESSTMTRDDALAVETRTFIAMAQTSVALSLTGIFLNDQLISKKAKTLAKSASKLVSKAAVIGAGIMGGGIAYQSALKRIPVKMKDVSQSGIDLGMNEANKLLAKRVERGRLTAVEMGQVLNGIEPTLSYDGFEGVDLVVEAVIENSDIKRSVLAEVENRISDDTIVTSNTSTISINYLAESLQRPENFCGMHFFNPVHAMPLVEVIRGSKTSNAAIAATVAYASAMGKKAIVVGDCPGFLVNRILFPYFTGFSMLLRDGADFQQVDRVMEAWGWPMGPAYLLDVVGIDTAIHAESVMSKGFPERMERNFTSATDVLYAAKRLGQKSNEGFYRYEQDKRGKPKKLPDNQVYDMIKPHVAENRDFSDDEIVARMMIPMATELARCLEEGIVDSVAEADMALVYGIGFPPFRGGVFRWIDDMNINNFCDLLESHHSLGNLYFATPGMELLKANGGQYYSVEGK
jgi:3-hydroxyacyl-CoA dehydrogenase/enoyl-CoA hydratase/3-hydroxybutyryl-CoA epimerase/enoyl-CoA isomerase